MITLKMKKLLMAVAALSFAGMLVTSYLTYLHFSPEASELCNIGEQFNCEVVNKSQWSYVDLGFVEIPVAIMGLGAYTFFFVMSLLLVKGVKFEKIHSWLRTENVLKLMRWLAVVGVLFSLYLSYIEAFVLQTWCIFCLTQQVLILLIMLLLFVAKKTAHQKSV